MDLKIINERVDKALADNRRAGNIVVAMATAIFALGIMVILLAYWQKNLYVSSGTVLFQGLLYWPIREILKLRRDNVILQTLPVLISGLDAQSAAREIGKLLAHLRGQH